MDPELGDLVPLTFVPVEVFGDDCACHEDRKYGEGKDGCEGWSYGFCDAVESWSDCNRAWGKIYRVDDSGHRKPGDTVTVYVPRTALPWFEQRHGDQGEEDAATTKRTSAHCSTCRCS